MGSQNDCARAAHQLDGELPVETALSRQLLRPLTERVCETLRRDMQLVAERTNCGEIRDAIGDRWLALANGLLQALQPGKRAHHDLMRLECDVFSDAGKTAPSHGGTPFAISKRKS